MIKSKPEESTIEPEINDNGGDTIIKHEEDAHQGKGESMEETHVDNAKHETAMISIHNMKQNKMKLTYF